jgi:hypothetical protein
VKDARELYGIVAEFETPEHLLRAATRATETGYRRLDAYTPFPLEGLSDAIGFKTDRVARITLSGAILGGLTGYLMQYYANVIDYPLNIGGRPYHSWPAFIPVTFELTVLGGALSAAFGMLILNRLPRLHHPVFNHQDFNRASKDRFFLCIQAIDPQFDSSRTSEFLSSLEPILVQEVFDED